MEKKIKALKEAYAAKDAVKLRNAARAIVANDKKHPFAAICCDGVEIVTLAYKIAAAPSLPF